MPTADEIRAKQKHLADLMREAKKLTGGRQGAAAPIGVDASKDDLARWKAAPLEFFADVIVPVASGNAPMGEVWADFQRETFAVLAEAVQDLGFGRKAHYRGLWIERTKGASKDSDVGLALLWLLLFSRRPQTIELCADDQEQILETWKAMQAVIRVNPWMDQRLTLTAKKITCGATASEAKFLTRDATGAHGSRPTVTVCNELSHCQSEEFISTVMDNADKISDNLVVIATNAGWLGSWQWRWRENYRTDEAWHFQKVDHPAPWIDARNLADAERRNSPSRFLRLWKGQWVRGGGDAIDPQDVRACVSLSGPALQADPGWLYAGALDLGIRHDHSALVIVGVQPGAPRANLVYVQTWKPDGTKRVDLEAVERDTVEACQRFRVAHLRYDPWQAVLMAQRLQRKGVPMCEITFVPANLDAMAKGLLNTFRNRKLALYHEPELLRDLERLNIVERSWGYKLECRRDEDEGHADRAIALAMLLPAVLHLLDLPLPPAGAVHPQQCQRVYT